MRKLTYGGANSADNFITGPDESIDWLRMNADVQQLIAESWRGVDTVLSGRKTFEFGLKMGGPAMKGVRSIVFSRTLEAVPEGIELVREDAVEFVRKLKTEPGGDIILMGGGELGTALIEGEFGPQRLLGAVAGTNWSTRSASTSTRSCLGRGRRCSGQ
jgi:dihydrofolate reductase